MTPRVLIVDNEDALRTVIARVLRRQGFEVYTAAGADSTYALLSEITVDAVMLDLHMPDMRGDALFYALIRRWPYLQGRIAIMSGDVEGIGDNLPSELQSCPRIEKPFDLVMLEKLILRLAAGPEERKQSNGR